MKRTVTTLGQLKEGDKFYFPTDKNKKAYVCLGWQRPYQHSPTRKWTMKYASTGLRKVIPALIQNGSGNREVVKLEHAAPESAPAPGS